MTAFNSKLRHNKLLIIVHVLPKTYDFQVLRCCFAEDIRKMCKDSKRVPNHCSAHQTLFGDVLVAVAVVVC